MNRYFVLDSNGVLRYFKKRWAPGSHEPALKNLLLQACTSISSGHVHCPGAWPSDATPSTRFCLEFAKRNYYCYAESEDECDAWLQAFMTAAGLVEESADEDIPEETVSPSHDSRASISSRASVTSIDRPPMPPPAAASDGEIGYLEPSKPGERIIDQVLRQQTASTPTTEKAQQPAQPATTAKSEPAAEPSKPAAQPETPAAQPAATPQPKAAESKPKVTASKPKVTAAKPKVAAGTFEKPVLRKLKAIGVQNAARSPTRSSGSCS